MPALEDVRWERFCQNIVSGVRKRGDRNTQGQLYIEAGFNAKDVGKAGGSAEACASRLLKQAKIENRIAELLHEAQQKATTKRAYTINEITDRMALASRIAEETRNPSALTSAERAIAEVRGLMNKPIENELDFKTARNMNDVGRKLLLSVGLREPIDDVSIAAAIEENDKFIAGLCRIRDAATKTIEQ